MASLSKLTLSSYRRTQPNRDPMEERRSYQIVTDMLAGLATKDARSVLASNLAYVSELAGLDCKVESAVAVRCALPLKTVPECENWRVGLLDTLLRARAELERQQSDAKRVIALISSLCTT